MSMPRKTDSATISRVIHAARSLAAQVDKLQFSSPVTHVYNPLDYAWKAHEAYLRMMNPQGARVLLLGMNPGPWGMAQTGVPFGHVPTVREWLRIDAPIGRPRHEHPKRPIQGLRCTRSEVSGERLWGLFRERFGTPHEFFLEHFVANYCPLVFMEESGRNRTPDKLPANERAALTACCDAQLCELVDATAPQVLVGVGAYAEKCLQRVTGDREVTVMRILHPSPASPAANRGWAETVTAQLVAAGVW